MTDLRPFIGSHMSRGIGGQIHLKTYFRLIDFKQVESCADEDGKVHLNDIARATGQVYAEAAISELILQSIPEPSDLIRGLTHQMTHEMVGVLREGITNAVMKAGGYED